MPYFGLLSRFTNSTEDGLALIDGHETNPACFPILVPKYDPVIQGVCMNVVRTATDRDRYCPSKNGPIEQLNESTAYLDLSIVYGNSEEELKNLRAFKYGHMTVEHRHDQDFPPHHPNPQRACDVNHDDDVCYLTGDVRANAVPQLMSFHIIFLREHNRLADELARVNSHWDDEYLFQEARKINIAQYQQITYYEWLPRTLGRDAMIAHYLIYDTKPGQYVDDYDEKMNAHVLNEFSTSAFRYLHNSIRGDLE
jgi:peroxidase